MNTPPPAPRRSAEELREMAERLEQEGLTQVAQAVRAKIPKKIKCDRPWRDYPLGTKAHAFMGGHWVKVENGWKWPGGSTFPTPGGDAIGECVELPIQDDDLNEPLPAPQASCALDGACESCS